MKHWLPIVTLLLLNGPAAASLSKSVFLVDMIKIAQMGRGLKTDRVLSFHDNNFYIQCLAANRSKVWRCEAAGFEGQPWLHNVLTLERQTELTALGFRPDAAFGNFVASIPQTIAADAMARRIIVAMNAGYGVKETDISADVDFLKVEPCHRRLKPGTDRGGAIFTPHFGYAKDVAKNCHPASNADMLNYDDPSATIPAAQGIDVDARYVPAMTAALLRVEAVPKGTDAYVIFEAGPAYLQCLHDHEDKAIYCEAVSEDAVGQPIARILTPERKAKLIAAGFEPPGRVMNYRRLYPRAQYDMTALAKILLGVLKDVYGYQGAPAMTVKTETGPRKPL